MARYASNNIEDFEEGGLYPGGTGVIEDIKYVLWDYDGKQPKDSVIAVYMKFQPTDGSNENKPVENYWAAGNDVASFAPDPTGGRLVILKLREKQSQSSNWALVLKKFRDNCGLEGAKLTGDDGIRALLRTELTLTRMDQPPREGLAHDAPPTGGEAKKFKPTLLVPTKAKFPWDKGAGRSTAAAKTGATATATTTTDSTAPPASNGAGSPDLSLLIKDIVTAAGGSMDFAAIPKELLGKLADVDRGARTALIKQAKDEKFIEGLATENGWTFDGKELIL
jgi:hypothetical protein